MKHRGLGSARYQNTTITGVLGDGGGQAVGTTDRKLDFFTPENV